MLSAADSFSAVAPATAASADSSLNKARHSGSFFAAAAFRPSLPRLMFWILSAASA